VLFLCFVFSVPLVSALNNGLALTPPMGWLSWQRFRCNIDCVNDPYNCISEKLYTDMADRLVDDGWAELGYVYVNIDDCWAAKKRDPQTNRLVGDPVRFPHGIAWLADYMHSRGLKLGIYGDYGTETCGGWPGSLDYLQLDAQTWADWKIDSIKLDGCNGDLKQMPAGYAQMAQYLNATGQPMLFSCSWPAYFPGQNLTIDWSAAQKNCNLWRLFDDIMDDYDSVQSIWEYWGKQQSVLQPIAIPGAWNDMDMVICGDFSLSKDECEAHFFMWSILASPLYMSNDLRQLPEFARTVLMNAEIIEVSQDPLGIQGKRIWQNGPFSIWSRPLHDGSQAVAFLSEDNQGTPSNFTVTWKQLGISTTSAIVRDLYAHRNLGTFQNQVSLMVNIHGLRALRVWPLTQRAASSF